MSNVYVLEPPTAGKVVLTTSLGELDIELWPKEAPKAVRNFVQLCMEGYYTGSIFHRVIPQFMVQGGDPTGTGQGGESIYGAPFKDEVHSRLKFSHRGIVACAGEPDKPNSNGSQFFFTLDRCDWLDKKHTIFGKITGDTIYNALKFGDIDIGEDDRPVEPPKILDVEVLWNPFDDIVPREVVKKGPDPAAKAVLVGAKASQPKKKQLNLLSFGEEAEEDEDEGDNSAVAPQKLKIRSSHDVLHDDPRLLKTSALDLPAAAEPSASAKGVSERLRVASGAADRSRAENGAKEEAAREKRDGGARAQEPMGREKDEGGDGEEDEDDAGFEARMRRQVLERQKQMMEKPAEPGPSAKKAKAAGADRRERAPAGGAAEPARRPAEPQRREERRADSGDEDSGEGSDEGSDEEGAGKKVSKLRLRKVGKKGSAAPDELEVRASKKPRGSLATRQQQTLERLAKFQSRLKQTSSAAKPSSAQAEEEGGRGQGGTVHDDARRNVGSSSKVQDEDDEQLLVASHAWLKHRLHFSKDAKAGRKDDMERNDDPNQYVVHDPLLEKGKEKFNKMQAKAKKRGREWAGRSLD